MEGVNSLAYWMVEGETCRRFDGAVIAEGQVCIYVNGREWVTLMCTPSRLEELALGFLRSAGVIQTLSDVEALIVAEKKSCVDIWLCGAYVKLPSRRIVTSGCGGGVTFDDLTREQAPLPDLSFVTPGQVVRLMKQLYQQATLYNTSRGVHTSALSDGEKLLLVAEDVGRHNTIDRLWGQALVQDLSTSGRLLLTSGRISSEMLSKAAKMAVPIVISRTSPTSLSVQLAQAWNLTLIGYARGDHFHIYAAPQRVLLNASSYTPIISNYFKQDEEAEHLK